MYFVHFFFTILFGEFYIMDFRKICQCSNNKKLATSNSYANVLKYLESKNCCDRKKCHFECLNNGFCFILPEKPERQLYKNLIRLSAHILYQYSVINALPYGVGILNQSLQEYESTSRNSLLVNNFIIEPDWDCFD